MIQRIQSIYLVLAAGLLGGTYYLPFAHANATPATALPATNAFADQFLRLTDSQLGMGCLLVSAIFCLIAIFRYQNRLRQMMTSWVAIVGSVAGLGAMAYEWFMDKSALPAENQVSPDLGGLAVLSALILLFLAIRSIRSDEQLVKSMDRLR